MFWYLSTTIHKNVTLAQRKPNNIDVCLQGVHNNALILQHNNRDKQQLRNNNILTEIITVAPLMEQLLEA